MKFGTNFKIVALFTIIVSLAFLGIASYLYYSLTEDAHERVRARLFKETQLAAAFVDKYVTGRPLTYGVDEVTDLISGDIGARVTITGLYGTVIGDSELNGGALKNAENIKNEPEIARALKSKYGYDSRMDPATKRRMFYVATAFGGEKPEGFIRLALPLSDVEAISENLKTVLIIAVPSAFLISIIAVFIASFFISRPIRLAEKKAENIARDFSRISDERDAKVRELEALKAKKAKRQEAHKRLASRKKKQVKNKQKA